MLSHVLFNRCALRAWKIIVAAVHDADFNARRRCAIMHAARRYWTLAVSRMPLDRIMPEVPNRRTGK